MGENEYLELVRKKTTIALWILLWTPIILAFVFGSPEKDIAIRGVILACDSAMVTMFVMRRNWMRAALFALFAVAAFGALIR